MDQRDQERCHAKMPAVEKEGLEAGRKSCEGADAEDEDKQSECQCARCAHQHLYRREALAIRYQEKRSDYKTCQIERQAAEHPEVKALFEG